MAINLQTRSISKAFPISLTDTLQILLLLLAGFAATWLHYRLRVPLRMPGRHGLEFMLIVMGARYLSNMRLASTFTVTGSIVAALVPGFGFTDPILPYVYVGMGLLIDFAWYRWHKILVWVPVAAMLGGIVYSLIPISRIVFFSLSGYMYGTFSAGYIVPILTHIAFGFIGALAGVGLASGIKKIKK